MKKYVMVIDEGTTGIRALIFNREFKIVADSYEEFTQYTPEENMVEHNAIEIYEKSVKLCRNAMDSVGIYPNEIASIGITNQRATSVVWDRNTGLPLAKAIVWQDTRTANLCDEINSSDWGEIARRSTGWTVAPVYSSLMLRWYLENVDGLRERIEDGSVLFGTMDTWLLWKLSGGVEHKVGYSNASVMGSMDLASCTWNKEFLDYLGVPVDIYPEIVNDAGHFGDTDKSIFGESIPIHSMVADQHAALFSQGCVGRGNVKCTHGTGSFLDINIGSECFISDKGINTVVAWKIGDEISYALEGYAAVTGSAIQWLRDGLRIIDNPKDTEAMAYSVDDTNGVYFVPALAGLSAPFHDAYARGTIIGITRGTTREHIVKATLEAIAYRCKDIFDAVEEDSGVKISMVKIDGGASQNNFIAQQMADVMKVPVERPRSVEATSLGAAQMAGLAADIWTMEDFKYSVDIDRRFTPNENLKDGVMEDKYAEWCRAVERASGWKSPLVSRTTSASESEVEKVV